MGGSHSLGNDESVRVISVDPAAQQAEFRFGWLDWVGPLTLHTMNQEAQQAAP